MKIRAVLFIVPAALAATIALVPSYGCGGKTAGTDGTTSDPDRPSVSITATPARVNPGQKVTITWTSHNADRVRSSNFGADRVSGSIEVHPTVDATYAIEVSKDYEEASASVQAKVNSSSEQYLIVGSTGDAQVTGIRDILATLTTTPVQIQPDIPNSGGTYHSVVIHQSGTFGAADAARVKAILDAGKGVVILGRSACKLATGNLGNNTLTAIGSWFGGATEMRWYGETRIVSADGWLNVPRPIWGHSIESDDGTLATGLIPSSQIVVGDGSSAYAFAFQPSSGGRLYYQSHPYGFGNEQLATTTLFKAGTRWTAMR